MEKILATITNRWTYLEFPFPEEIRGFFSFLVPARRFMPKFQAKKWDGTISMMKGSRIPTSLFLLKREAIEKELDVRFRVRDQRELPLFRPRNKKLRLPGIKEIRDYQWEAVEAMITVSSTGGLVLNATGTGKTLIAGLYFRHLIGNAVFIVDERTLLYQAKEELEKITGEEVGIIGDSERVIKRVTVATIQTLSMGQTDKPVRQFLRNLEAIVIDEVHLALNERQFEVARKFEAKAVFGLTATLELKKDHVAFQAMALTGPKIYEYSYAEGVKEEHLTPGIVLAVDFERGFIPENFNSFHELYYQAIVASRKRNDYIEAVTREALRRGRHVAILVERVPHVRKFSARLADIPHEAVFGERKVVDRIEAKAKFEGEEIKLLIANTVFKKGINLKKLDLIIDAAGMANGNDAVQKFGRGVRLSDAKTGLIYVDVGDSLPRKAREAGMSNVFERASRTRRRALRERGIRILQVLPTLSPERILDTAEKTLKGSEGWVGLTEAGGKQASAYPRVRRSA